MSTALVLGNGNLLVNINDRLNISDLYWPHVGQENQLARQANEIFFLIDGRFSSITDMDWQITPAYKSDSLVTFSRAINPVYNLELIIESAVLPDKDIFVRKFKIKNFGDKPVSVITYLKNNFYILEDDVGNTAAWYPAAQLLVHYKKARYIGVGSTGKIHQFTCAGPLDNNGKGAFPNLTTGGLKFNAAATGSAQSCISYNTQLEVDGESSFDSLIVCGSNFDQLTNLAFFARTETTDILIESTNQYWKNWIENKMGSQHQSVSLFSDPDFDKQVTDLYKRSLLTIRTQIDNGGAIMAANDSTYVKEGGKDSYSYFWPRDGALTALALIDVGFGDLSKRLFRLLNSLITKEGYFLHKYYPKAESGLASSWHAWVDEAGFVQLPIQEDETALVVYALHQHFSRFGDHEFLNEIYHTLVLPAANFLLTYKYDADAGNWSISDYVSGFNFEKNKDPLDTEFAGSALPRPSYDIWEVQRGLHTYTIATVCAGLKSAAELAHAKGDLANSVLFGNAASKMKDDLENFLFDKNKGRFLRSIVSDRSQNNNNRDDSLDSSMNGLWLFDTYSVNDPKIEATVAAIEERLTITTGIGGVARKENDNYHRTNDVTGNPWPICSLWLAQYWLKKGDKNKARPYLEWVIARADSTGLLAEQSDPVTGFARSVKPLTWSHAEFVRAYQLLVKDK